jgi:hypothetical protein
MAGIECDIGRQPIYQEPLDDAFTTKDRTQDGHFAAVRF